MLKLFFVLNIIVIITSLPVAVIHGFYDSCDSAYFPALVNLLKYNLGDYATCLRTGEGSKSLSLSIEEQAKKSLWRNKQKWKI